MKKLLRRGVYEAAHRLPTPSRTAYDVCRVYVDRFRGENNRDTRLNGEAWIVRDRLPAAEVVVDAGACFGEWAEMALAANPDVRIHAFEPTPASFAKLNAAAFPDTVTRVNAALSDEPGEAEMHLFEGVAQANSLYVRDGSPEKLGPQSGRATVELVTLDGYCGRAGIERVDFLKIDVEGHELAVLKGAEGLLGRRAIGGIQFEYGSAFIASRTFLKDLWDLLQKHGYRLSKLYPDGPRPVPRYDLRLENFQYANYFAEPGPPAGFAPAGSGPADA